MDEIEFYKNAWNTVKQICIDRGYTYSNDYNLISDTDFKLISLISILLFIICF